MRGLPRGSSILVGGAHLSAGKSPENFRLECVLTQVEKGEAWDRSSMRKEKRSRHELSEGGRAKSQGLLGHERADSILSIPESC